MMATQQTKPWDIKVFISYAHEDEAFRQELV